MGESVQITEGVITDSDGNKDGLKFANSVSIGNVTLTSQPGTVNALLLNGQILSAHDALYALKQDMESSGAAVTEAAQDVGFPRWSLADAATNRVKWQWAIPAEWDQVAVRFGWNKEAAGSGNVVWQFAYRLVYPFSGEDVDASAVTTIALGAKAVSGTTFGFQYEIPNETQAINVADGAFGSKPFMLCSLSRLGADAGDTYAGAVAVTLATLTRTV